MKLSQIVYDIILGVLTCVTLVFIGLVIAQISFSHHLLSVAVIIALGACGICAFAVSREAQSRKRISWQLIALSFTLYAVSRLLMFLIFTLQGQHTPYPCFGDYINVIASFTLSVALTILATLMIHSGLPIGKKFGYRILITIILIAATITDYKLLVPIIESSSSKAQIALSSIYIITGSINLSAVFTIVTVSLHFHGRVRLSWLHTVIGLVVILASATLFACKKAFPLPAYYYQLTDILELFGNVMILRGITFLRHWPRRRRPSQPLLEKNIY